VQPRDINKLKRLIEDARELIEPDFAFLVSADPNSREKIATWGVDRSHGVIVVPLHSEQLTELAARADVYSALPDVIAGWIAAYNLYDERGPVTGERFFGRGDLMRDLERKLIQGVGHVGVFGLRRIGKTSVLLSLKERLRGRKEAAAVFIDLEASPSVASFRLFAHEKARARHVGVRDRQPRAQKRG
jgi:serine/threonine-protein kinase